MRIFNKYFWKDINHKLWGIVWGFRNLKTYFKVVWSARPWDFNYTPLEMLKMNLQQLLLSIENGYEIEESRDVKVKDIKRCIELIDNLVGDDYIGYLGGLSASKYPISFEPVDDSPKSEIKGYLMVEHRTPEEIADDSQKIQLSVKLQQNDWDDLWTIINKNGQGWWD